MVTKVKTLSSNVSIGGISTENGSLTITDNLTVDTDTLFVQSSSNNVGIGTTTPDHLLDCELGSYGVTARFMALDGTRNPRLIVYGDASGTHLQHTFSSSADSLIFENGGSEGSGNEIMRIDSTAVGIGTSSPTSYGNSNKALIVEDSGNPAIGLSDTGQTRDWWLVALGDGLGVRYADGGGSGSATNVTQSMFFKNNGDVGIGTSEPENNLHIATDAGSEGLLIKTTGDTSNEIVSSANRSSASVVINQFKGQWNGNDVTDIRFYAGSDTANKDDGAIMFLTSLESSNPVQRMYIRADGGVGVGTSGASTVRLYSIEGSNRYVSYNYATNAAYSNEIIVAQCGRTATSAFNFFTAYSSGDTEFKLAGDGNAYADGSWSGGGADYAEMFEWDDGNSSNEDRRGFSVVLTNGNKIRKATSSDAASDIIGVVSANPTVMGDNAWNVWNEKYNKDDFGGFVMETYTITKWTEPAVADVDGNITEEDTQHNYETDKIPSDVTVPSDAVVVSVDDNGNTLKRKQLNPSYDDTQTYTPREERQEWDAVGMMGKLRMRAGQPTGDRWIKMRDIASDSDGNVTVEEWLVR